MILLVARREVLGHLRSSRFKALVALVVALFATGSFVNARRFEARMRYADALDALRATTVAVSRDDPQTASSRYGWRGGRGSADPALRAVRPPTPASVFAIGADLAAPGYWQFGTEGVMAGPARSADDPSAAEGASLDVEFVVRAVLSLVALLLAADTVAGDRDRGVLRTLFAAPVSRLDLLLGKYVGGLLTLSFPLVAGTTAAALVAAWLHVPLFGAGVTTRLLLLAAGSVLFLAAMLALGLCVSARCRDGHTAVVVLVTLWTVLVVVMPGTSALMAGVARPVMPEELHHQGQVDGIRQLEIERASALAGVWRRVAGTDDVPLDSAVSLELRRSYDAAREPVEAALMRQKRDLLRTSETERHRQQASQLRFIAALSVLSPAATFRAFAATVAGTGVPATERWERAVADHQRRLEAATFDRAFATELFAARQGYLRITYLPNGDSPTSRVPRYADLPAFAAPGTDLRQDVRTALPAIGVLVAHMLIFLGGAAVALLRTEV